jgi:TonB family protein
MFHFKSLKVILCGFLLLSSASALIADSIFSDEEVAESSAMNELDSPPKPTKQSQPSIPPELKGLKASVQIGFLIDEKGNVVKPRIVQSSNPSFNEISLKCIRDWEFEPGTKGGQPVKVRVVIPLRFK